MKIKKASFIEMFAEKTGAESKRQAAAGVDAFLDLVVSSLSKGDEVSFPGFGTFRVGRRAAREGINPKTGEKIHIAASIKPKFRAGKVLKEAVK